MPTIGTGVPFTLQVVHDGLNTASYTLIQNGVEVSTPPYAPGGVVFSFPGGLATPGTYTFTVRANPVNPALFSAATSGPLVVSVAVPSIPPLSSPQLTFTSP